MRGRQHLVARLELERADDGIESRGRVRDEGEIVGPDAEERRERRARLGHPPRPFGIAPEPLRGLAREEVRRTSLELALDALILVEDLDWARAEAPVVELHDVRIEEEPVAHRRG